MVFSYHVTTVGPPVAPDGNVLWQQGFNDPPIPLYAISGGSTMAVTPGTLYTFDRNGNLTA
jgi:hypothetical protein